MHFGTVIIDTLFKPPFWKIHLPSEHSVASNLCSISIHDPIRLYSDPQQTFENSSLVTRLPLLFHFWIRDPIRTCTWMSMYAFVCACIYSHSAHTPLQRSEEKSSIWLMGIHSPVGNTQFFWCCKKEEKKKKKNPRPKLLGRKLSMKGRYKNISQVYGPDAQAIKPCVFLIYMEMLNYHFSIECLLVAFSLNSVYPHSN